MDWLHIRRPVAARAARHHVVRLRDLDVLPVGPALAELPEGQGRITYSRLGRDRQRVFPIVSVLVLVLGILRGTVFGRIQSIDALSTTYGIVWIDRPGLHARADLHRVPGSWARVGGHQGRAGLPSRGRAHAGGLAHRPRPVRRRLHLHDPHALPVNGRPMTNQHGLARIAVIVLIAVAAARSCCPESPESASAASRPRRDGGWWWWGSSGSCWSRSSSGGGNRTPTCDNRGMKLMPTGVVVTSDAPHLEEVLTPEALDFVAQLHRSFNPERERLLADRVRRQARLDAGETPDFLPNPIESRDPDVARRAGTGRLRRSARRDHRPGRAEDDDQRAEQRRLGVHVRLRGRALSHLVERRDRPLGGGRGGSSPAHLPDR